MADSCQHAGRILFALDASAQHRDQYPIDNANLSGRVMFANFPARHSAAAFLVLHNPIEPLDDIRHYAADPRYGTHYRVHLPGGRIARRNPQRGLPPDCKTQ